MALAYALRLIEQDKNIRLSNYGSFLAQFPPEYECEINQNTSWSCAHGVERWRSDCGCNGGRAGWNQQWRKPLRQAMDDLLFGTGFGPTNPPRPAGRVIDACQR